MYDNLVDEKTGRAYRVGVPFAMVIMAIKHGILPLQDQFDTLAKNYQDVRMLNTITYSAPAELVSALEREAAWWT